ncbi:MAG: carbamoyl-phosphate synthase large subunit [Desulfobacterales bacterium]
MPKRTDIHRILIIGAGPIIISQACEFDYSGTQACKALKEEGYEVILVNSNPATIMTDPETADRTYIEPVIPAVVAMIIEREKPDALLPTLGGQTGLNTAIEVAKAGILEKFGVEMIGASTLAIKKAEDRDLFRNAMTKIGLRIPKSGIARNMNEVGKIADDIGFPIIVRPSFTLGGTGGGVAYNSDDLFKLSRTGLDASLIGQVMLEESVMGWKEYELEVMRDKRDNVVIICSIENMDPMGVHTGDSITVAPAQTLSDKEYQMMRNASIAIMREIGVDTGGSNVQFAINPENGDMVVIEMNPRVSRSSALASKATGFPIAKIAAKLAVGYSLDEISNDITGETLASFEPTLDYCVVKVPRWTFEKFPETTDVLTTSMKSVGETMAIGRTFKEALQKGLRSLEIGRYGLGADGKDLPGDPNIKNSLPSRSEIEQKLASPNSQRIFYMRYALLEGMTIESIYKLTGIDPWFIHQLEQIVALELEIQKAGAGLSDALLKQAKEWGFSDVQLAYLTGVVEQDIRKRRQGIEFDYCCVHASFALREEGVESIMVNSNPETVSTDYDTSDKLYFEPLTKEDVLHIVETEQPMGVIVQFGGQTPLNLSVGLHAAGVPILGTQPESIDRAEDRKHFQAMLDKLGLIQPANGTALTVEEAVRVADTIGYPVIVRPSYVLGGRAMKIVYNQAGLENFTKLAIIASPEYPVLIDKFVEDAFEFDVDAISDGRTTIIGGIMEHIEEAGVHSGDSACVLPPINIESRFIEQMSQATKAMAKELNVVGLMNVQFALKDGQLYVLEVNPRASRTIPFVSKATGVPLAKLATKVMLGRTLQELGLTTEIVPRHISVKEAVLPFDRFPDVDILLGPEMKSTGEVMGIGTDFGSAYAKAQLGAGQNLPTNGTVFISVIDNDKKTVLPIAAKYRDAGFKIMATTGTSNFLVAHGIANKVVNKVSVGRPHVVDAIKNAEIQLVINTSIGGETRRDGYYIRRNALRYKIPYATTTAGGMAIYRAIETLRQKKLNVKTLQEYNSES